MLKTLFFCSAVLASVSATTAEAATLIVGQTNTTCPDAQYSTIGKAVDAASPGDTIEICPALYAEQLTITKPLTLRGMEVNGVNRVLLQPAVMIPAVSVDGSAGNLPVEAVITVLNTKGVTIQNLAIDASKSGVTGCSPLVAAVLYYGSSGKIANNAILGAQVRGCTGDSALLLGNGMGIEIDANPLQPGDLDVSVERNSVASFTRNGIQVVGSGIAAQVKNNAISGQGPGGGVFQFGVFIRDGAVGLVRENVIHEGSCGTLSSDDCFAARTEGVVLRAVGDGTVVDHNVISSAQSGIFANGGSRARITNNFISDIDLLDGIDIQGTASGFFTNSVIEGNTIFTAGPVSNQSCGIFEAAGTGVSGNTISNNVVNDAYCGVAAVTTDRVRGGIYHNTLYTEINAELPPPDPVEP